MFARCIYVCFYAALQGKLLDQMSTKFTTKIYLGQMTEKGFLRTFKTDTRFGFITLKTGFIFKIPYNKTGVTILIYLGQS